tara:strand:+ start:1624 stop:2580 length:957 start_codon:yes stop_codon:yes gene_type:complete
MKFLVVSINRAETYDINAKVIHNFFTSKNYVSSLISERYINFNKLFLILKEILKSNKIISPTPTPFNILFLFFCKLFGKDFFIGIHDPEPHEGKNYKRTLIYNFILTSLSSGILVFSEYSKNVLKSKMSNKNIYQLLLLPSSNSTTLEKIIKDFQYDFSLIGRLELYKGVDEFIMIAEQMPEKKFLLTGEDLIGIDEKKLPQNITFRNSYLDFDEYTDYIRKSKVLLMPYKSATQSGVVADAFQNKTFLISRNVGAIKEQLDVYKNGCVYDSLEEGLSICKNISEDIYQISEENQKAAIIRMKKKRDKHLDKLLEDIA